MLEIKSHKIYDRVISGHGKWKNKGWLYRKAGRSTHENVIGLLSRTCESLMEHMVIDDLIWIIFMTMTSFCKAIAEF